MQTFTERNEQIFKTFGHLMEGVTHYTKNEDLAKVQQNKMAVLIDNAIKDFGLKTGLPSYEAIKEAMTTNASAATFVKTQLPLIRKVFPSMISQELVSVQPMSQPTTKIFYYDIQRDDATSVSADIHNRRTYADNEEYNPNSPKAIKEIVLKITDSSLTAVEKKLKASNTIESYQDIMAYHGINVASDLNFALGAEIVREWDRMVLQYMLDGATGGAATFDQSVPAGITYTDRKVWMETFYEKLIDIDTQIFKKTYRKTNWIVVPAEVAGFMEKMAGFRADDAATVEQKIISTGGRYFMGTLNSRWRIYVDPFFPANKVLMGYNNASNWMDTCYVWAPYILSYFSDPFTNPDTFVTTRAILSRAGMKCVRGDLLGVLTITGS